MAVLIETAIERSAGERTGDLDGSLRVLRDLGDLLAEPRLSGQRCWENEPEDEDAHRITAARMARESYGRLRSQHYLA